MATQFLFHKIDEIKKTTEQEASTAKTSTNYSRNRNAIGTIERDREGGDRQRHDTNSTQRKNEKKNKRKRFPSICH